MDKTFQGDDPVKGSFRGSTGLVIGRGETGLDPDGPECGVCYAIGGGGHGGFCPNAGNPDPDTWTSDAPPGYEKPLREAPSQHGGPVTERPYAHPVGQAAYEAYKATAGGVSLVSGDSLPDWAALPEPIREAWDAAGMAARDVDLGP